VRSSHERVDGGGYPDGMSGDDIPVGARIVFACNAYHAMVSGRPYAGAVTIAEACAELRRCAGSQFDIVVIEALCEVLADGGTPRILPRAVEAVSPRGSGAPPPL
jgi:HD-GYP domain-containing protein (c-di-GMP phosphodiesterase class II)